jgi:uncharacterized membrane protein
MGRVEAFSDGVIAIIITIMVLDLKVPHETTLAALVAIWPTMLSYVLSFLVVAIMWINHHHLLHTAKHADAGLLWSNCVLLFWMSLIPFVTRYLGDNRAAPLPVAVYSGTLACTCVAFSWFQSVLARHNSSNEHLTRHYGKLQRKAAFCIVMYMVAALTAFASPKTSLAILIVLPALYFLPEKRLVEVERQAGR